MTAKYLCLFMVCLWGIVAARRGGMRGGLPGPPPSEFKECQQFHEAIWQKMEEYRESGDDCNGDFQACKLIAAEEVQIDVTEDCKAAVKKFYKIKDECKK